MSSDPSLKNKPQERWYEPKEQSESIWNEIVYQTKSGDSKRFHTKPGERRVQEVHSGGHVSMSTELGHHFEGTPGHSVSYTQGGSSTTTDNNADSKGGGFSRSQSKQESYSSHAGDKSSCCGGDRAEVVMGTLGISATKNIYLGAGTTLAINATGDLEIKAKNINFLTPGGTISMNGTRMFGSKGGTGGGSGGSSA